MSIQQVEEVVLAPLTRDHLQTLTKEQLIYLVQDLDIRIRRTDWAAYLMTGTHVFDMPKIRRMLAGKE